MPCSPRMRACHRNCLHRAMVEQYRAHRLAWERRRDEWAIGYPTDERDYARVTGDLAPTLREWLKSWSVATRSSLDEELAS